MIPTSIPIRSTKRPSGQTLQTSDGIWAAAKASRVELRPLRSRPAASAPALAPSARKRGGTREPIAVVGGDGCSRRHLPYRVIRSISAKSSADSVHPVAQQPTERQLEHGVIPACGEGLEFADDAPVALAEELLRVAWVLRQPRPRRQRRATRAAAHAAAPWPALQRPAAPSGSSSRRS